MTASLGAVSAAQFALQGREALTSLAKGASVSARLGTDTVRLPNGLRPGAFSETRIGLNTKDARNALTFALAAGRTILDALGTLEKIAALADHPSLVNPNFNLLVDDGTRLSRLNIDAQAGLIIGRIDILVATTKFRSANFLSSSGGNINIQTSRYGGSINVIPQPLDSVGLGIANLDFLTDDGVNAAVSAIDQALRIAGVRIDRLATLHSALNNPDVFASGITDIISNATSDVLPRGSAVNLVA